MLEQNTYCFEDFPAFVETRRQYGDGWANNWPKLLKCPTCEMAFQLSASSLNNIPISAFPFEAKSQYPWLETYLVVNSLNCPHCKLTLTYIDDGHRVVCSNGEKKLRLSNNGWYIEPK